MIDILTIDVIDVILDTMPDSQRDAKYPKRAIR